MEPLPNAQKEGGRLFSKLDFSGRGGEGRGWNRKWALADPVMQERGGVPGLGALFETVFFDSKKSARESGCQKRAILLAFVPGHGWQSGNYLFRHCFGGNKVKQKWVAFPLFFAIVVLEEEEEEESMDQVGGSDQEEEDQEQ